MIGNNKIKSPLGYFKVEGAVRHETAQVVEEFYGWQAVISVYQSDVIKILALKDVVLEEALKEYLKKGRFGWEQTIAELYAIRNGGAAMENIEPLMKKHFANLLNALEDKSWFRN